jgi:hypothetical protein
MLAILSILVVGADAAEAFRTLSCGATSKGYVVGAKLPRSGVFELTPQALWKQLGFNHPYIVAADHDPRDP